MVESAEKAAQAASAKPLQNSLVTAGGQESGIAA